MATGLVGLWQLDSIDLYTGFKAAIEKGTADFLKYAAAKESITYSWDGENGVEVDTSGPKWDARTITLQCFIDTETRAEFLENHDALITQLMLPGLHTFRIASHGLDRGYHCKYLRTETYAAATPLTNDPNSPSVYRFTLVLLEPRPTIGSNTSRIVTETGRFLIT